MERQKINYNQNLKGFARNLRKGRIRSEVMMWQELQKKKFKGHTFNRQVSIGGYIVDFFCAKAKVVIEIDGKTHDAKQEYDKKRDQYLQSQGLTVIHVEHMNVIRRFDYVMYHLERHPAFESHTPSASPPPLFLKGESHTPAPPNGATPLS